MKDLVPKLSKLPKIGKIKAIQNALEKIYSTEAKAGKEEGNNMYKMLNAGSFTRESQIHQLLSMPGLQKDLSGDIIPIPIQKSYGEGLSTPEYYTTMYGVRRGTVDRSVNTQNTGALNKALLNVTRRLLITEEDCGTRKGIELEVKDKNLLDRFALETIVGVVKRNSLITTETF